jgi:hypothetical protein
MQRYVHSRKIIINIKKESIDIIKVIDIKCQNTERTYKSWQEGRYTGALE